MHALHEHLVAILLPHLKAAGTVVWYDPRREFEPFVAELAKSELVVDLVTPMDVGGFAAHLLVFGHSYFATKVAAEPWVTGDQGAPLVIYLPGETWDPKGSLLMELDLAGKRWDPSLKREARRCLQKAGYSEGTIDELLKTESLGYLDLVTLLAEQGGSTQVNLLRTVFDQEDAEALLATWLAEPSRDAAILAKGAVGELEKLVTQRLGAPFATEGLAKARAKLWRYLLVQEFLADWKGASVPALAQEGKASKKEELERIHKITTRLRRGQRAAYAAQADAVEQALGLAQLGLDPANLGRTDTFRFEERALFHQGAELVIAGQYGAAEQLAVDRLDSFWVEPARAAQWEVCRRMAVLGQHLQTAETGLKALKGEPQAWVAWYVDGPQAAAQVDQAYRELETTVASLEDDPEAAKAYAVTRQRYVAFVQAATTGFTQALRQKAWQVAGVLPQTRVYADVVQPLAGKTAFFLVDAMRFEMGLSLAARLAERVDELRLTPVVAALPTITTVGMAALLPGAAASFAVVQVGNKLGAQVDKVFLPDQAARKKYLKERVPSSEDLDLGSVLEDSVEKLKTRLAAATLVLVRSQEIDAAGEIGFGPMARRVMEGLLTTDLVKAIQKLQRAGVTQFVLCADHGHQFARTKGDDMKLESPVGQHLEDHRRCIIGHGLEVGPGTVKATAAELGYPGALDFLFPVGAGVFKAGGDLAFHHGGPSLQELIVPLLTFRAKASPEVASETTQVRLTWAPEAITNRIFSVRVELQAGLFGGAVKVHPVLLAGDRLVGEALIVKDATLDPATHQVALEPGQEAELYFQVADSLEGPLHVQISDPQTDQVLAKSKPLPISLAI